jgi:hypothetical protein
MAMSCMYSREFSKYMMIKQHFNGNDTTRGTPGRSLDPWRRLKDKCSGSI